MPLRPTLLALAALLCSPFVLAAVNVNTASRAELESLPEIGPAKAQAILDWRQQHGPFKSVDELKNVPGIGDKTLATIRKDVATSGPTSLPAHAGKPAPAGKPATPGAKPAVAPAQPARPAPPPSAPAAKPATGLPGMAAPPAPAQPAPAKKPATAMPGSSY